MTNPITRERDRSTAEIIGICLLCFGWFTLGSMLSVMSSTTAPTAPAQGAAASVQFSSSAFVSIIVCELLFGAVALLILRLRGYAPAALLPNPTYTGALAAIPLYLAVTLIAGTAIALMTNRSMAEPLNDMMPRAPIPLPLVITLGMVNGLYEETFLLGYLQRAVSRHGTSVAIGISVLVRMLYHLYQGPVGSVSIVVYGAMMGLFYARTGWLWTAVVTHALADIIPFL